MKLNKLMNIALTLSLALGALVAGAALTQEKADAMFATADLVSKIEAFEDAALTKPIPNGQERAYGGGAPTFYVRVSVKNVGAVKAENFKMTYAVRRSGVDVYKPADLMTLSLDPNQTKVFPVVAVTLAGTTNEVTASTVVNPMKFMPEDNMANNNAKLKVIGTVVH